MTNKEPTPEQQSMARNFLADTQEFLFETVKLAVKAKQGIDNPEDTDGLKLAKSMIVTAASAVSLILTDLLDAECITLDQAEFLKNQLNSYYEILIKGNLEND